MAVCLYAAERESTSQRDSARRARGAWGHVYQLEKSTAARELAAKRRSGPWDESDSRMG